MRCSVAITAMFFGAVLRNMLLVYLSRIENRIFPCIRDPFLFIIFTSKIGGLLYMGVSLLAPVCIVVRYAGMQIEGSLIHKGLLYTGKYGN